MTTPHDPAEEKAPKGPDLPLPVGETEGEVRFERTIPSRVDRLTGRTRERIRAVDVVFEADARHLDVADVLQQRLTRTATQTPLPDRAKLLVQLYVDHAEEIDEQLSTHSRDWPLHRMPAVDRATLRLGAAELLFGAEDAERGAVIGEYTKIVAELSTDDSPRFVNGLLQRLSDIRGLLG